jgi:putative ABC transport system ATP-binding protein
MSSAPLVSLEQVSKVYHMGQTSVHALRNATFFISAGELVGIFGPSGSGKTTLLTMAGLLDRPSSGTIRFNGQTVSEPHTELDQLRDFRCRHIGFVFQKPNLIPFLNASGNVQIALHINGVPAAEGAVRARFLLEQFGIGARAGHMPAQLSGGEQQRVAIARALANNPVLILADEPTASLDRQRGRQVMETFRRLADFYDVAVCVVTHDSRHDDLFDRRIEIADGSFVERTYAGSN